MATHVSKTSSCPFRCYLQLCCSDTIGLDRVLLWKLAKGSRVLLWQPVDASDFSGHFSIRKTSIFIYILSYDHLTIMIVLIKQPYSIFWCQTHSSTTNCCSYGWKWAQTTTMTAWVAVCTRTFKSRARERIICVFSTPTWLVKTH